MARLREVTREFARGEAPLETLRRAALREPIDRPLADGLLQLIAEWENGAWPNSRWARSELRDRAERLVPAAPEPRKRTEDATATMYGAGLRGHLRSN